VTWVCAKCINCTAAAVAGAQAGFDYLTMMITGLAALQRGWGVDGVNIWEYVAQPLTGR
jgi:hypothetical protein